MLRLTTDIFDNIDDKFVARLREVSSNTRTTSDGKATITFKTARIEANYSPDIIRKIEAGRLVAIPNVLGVNSKNNYSIYEVADVYPMHYSMLTLDRNQPGAIRKEFMTLIEKEWQQGSKNTWIEIVAAPTGHILQMDTNIGESTFIRKNIAPLMAETPVCVTSVVDVEEKRRRGNVAPGAHGLTIPFLDSFKFINLLTIGLI